MRDDQDTARFLRVCDRGGERQRQCQRGREASPISPHRTYLPRRSHPSRRRACLAELSWRMPTAAGYTAADRGAIPASGRSERLRRGRCQVRTDFEPSVPRDTTKVSRGLMSPLPTEKSARTTSDTTLPQGAFRGTDGSNPPPSTAESATNCSGPAALHRRIRFPPAVSQANFQSYTRIPMMPLTLTMVAVWMQTAARS